VIGRVIDKYRILEEVGQGGMSVVYKGMDTSLNREVAVKVLHPHLASHDEARERFEREAHAVAKLRHENILEIFDYSGKESPDSYIVTEFIRGRTLRTFTAAHHIAFPEIAAMIVVEVCRALQHAHSLGVLHRDVKPENIMIREDGVLKLMDFGIAQIVDSQRMTVTGQLLGSPAYMSPEHIEGRPLDFRTDVFSVGILLYQLTTNELPFKGRNPHEILKRIAECRFLDARVVNPLVPDRLNKIIGKALARLPEDRYPDVGVLLDDLTRFLADLDLGEPRSELLRFFRTPLPYEQAFRQRLIAALTQRGKEELTQKHAARALAMWNRVLTIDPANDEVLRLIDRLSHRRRVKWGLVAGLALLALSGGVALAWEWMDRRPPAEKVERVPVALPPDTPDAMVTSIASPPPAAEPDAAPEPVVIQHPHPATTPRPLPPRPAPARPTVPRPAAVPAERVFRLVPTPKNAFYSVDGGDPVQVSMGRANVTVGPGGHTIELTHPLCEPLSVKIDAAAPAGEIVRRLTFKPTRVRVTCPSATAILLNGRAVSDGTSVDILEFTPVGKRQVEVEFLVGGAMQQKRVTVTAGEPQTEVACDGT
jgi:predicted Ser/Thr protein kinase